MPKKSKRNFTLNKTIASTRTAKAAKKARAELLIARTQYTPGEALPIPGFGTWSKRYNEMICDYLLVALTDKHLPAWVEAYTALWELTSAAWVKRPESSPALQEREAWAQADVAEHLEVTRWFTLLPNLSHQAFYNYYAGFLRFAVDEGAMDRVTSARLVAELELWLFEERLGAA